MAQTQARAAFSGDKENMPQKEIASDVKTVVDILVAIGAAPSKGEARRLIDGGGVKLDGEKVDSVQAQITDSQAANGFVLQKGKKNFFKVTVK